MALSTKAKQDDLHIVEERYTTRSIMKAFSITASLVLTTTFQPLNFLTHNTPNLNGTHITKSNSPTIFTFHSTGYYNFLIKIRATQTGAGSDTICNVKCQINGVDFGTESRPINQAGVNSFSFMIMAVLLQENDIVQFFVSYSGSGGVTLSTSADGVDNMSSITIIEYL